MANADGSKNLKSLMWCNGSITACEAVGQGSILCFGIFSARSYSGSIGDSESLGSGPTPLRAIWNYKVLQVCVIIGVLSA